MGLGRGSYDFNKVGPTHLKHVDWRNPDHKRIVLACFVMGVYVLEHDRQDKGELALPQERLWFNSFGFILDRMLIDHEKDNSIYGAIYRFEHPSHLPPEAPEYVIAFRGTVLKAESFREDAKLNFQILHQRFHKKKRTIRATEAVESVVWPKKGTEDEDEIDREDKDVTVWLVGHSLGSSLAIQAGKKVAEKGVLLETFLFNPPYPSLGPERVPIKKIRNRIKKRTKKWKTMLAKRIKGYKQIHEDKVKFAKLSKWSPHIFVHRNDWICSGYIGYFEQRKMLLEINDHEWMVDAMYSTRALWKDAWKQIFKKKKAIENKSGYYEPFYLLPCASLNISTRGVDKERGSDHGIKQWWMEDLQLENTLYTFDVSKLLEALGEQPSTLNDPPVDPRADESSSSHGSRSHPILQSASPAPLADSESAQMEVAWVGASRSSVIGSSGSGSTSRETSLSITPLAGETGNLGIMGTASSSSIPPRQLSIATAPLRSSLTERLGLCDKVSNRVSSLGSAYPELDAKRTELADIKKSEEDLAAKLEHIRTRRRSLEDEADELDKMVQDQQRSLKSTSLIEDLGRSMQSLDSDLQRHSSDAVFCEEFVSREELWAEHFSAIEAEFLSSIEDA